MTLATWGPEGPWATPVYYAADGFDLYFLSQPSSRHAGNIAARRRVAASVFDDPGGWREIRGVQLEGDAGPVPAASLPAATGVYLERFPFVREFLGEGGSLLDGVFRVAGRLVRARLYLLRPVRVFYLDNCRGFGARVQIQL